MLAQHLVAGVGVANVGVVTDDVVADHVREDVVGLEEGVMLD